jgi:hypothetical protein
MTVQALELGGLRAVAWPTDGAPLSTDRDAGDLIGAAFSHEARLVILPAANLSPDFLRLASGLAGDMLQKFVNYGLRVVIVGDIAPALKQSAPLRDFVRESNRGRQVWFVADLSELETRLATG